MIQIQMKKRNSEILHLMANSSEEPPREFQVTILTTIDMSNSENKTTMQELTVELFNVHISMIAHEFQNSRLILKFKNLKSKNEELGLIVVLLDDLKQKNWVLKKKVKCNEEIKTILRNQIFVLEIN